MKRFDDSILQPSCYQSNWYNCACIFDNTFVWSSEYLAKWTIYFIFILFLIWLTIFFKYISQLLIIFIFAFSNVLISTPYIISSKKQAIVRQLLRVLEQQIFTDNYFFIVWSFSKVFGLIARPKFIIWYVNQFRIYINILK